MCCGRIAVVRVAEGQLGEEVAFVLTEEAPLRMALHPQVQKKSSSSMCHMREPTRTLKIYYVA